MSIQEHLNKIRNAIYGKEVRESIAKGIETAYDDASEKGNANMEVKIARGTHPNLRSRLEEVDNKQQQTIAQLAQTDDNKLDKNRGAVTSADLSQEVKEQMTGGSVAVVGKNSVLTENIVDGQITPTKLSYAELSPLYGEVDLPMGKNELSSEGVYREVGYLKVDGSSLDSLNEGTNIASLVFPGWRFENATTWPSFSEKVTEVVGEFDKGEVEIVGEAWDNESSIGHHGKTSDALFVFVDKERFANEQEARDYLDENPIEIYYKLAQEEFLPFPDNLSQNTKEIIKLKLQEPIKVEENNYGSIYEDLPINKMTEYENQNVLALTYEGVVYCSNGSTMLQKTSDFEMFEDIHAFDVALDYVFKLDNGSIFVVLVNGDILLSDENEENFELLTDELGGQNHQSNTSRASVFNNILMVGEYATPGTLGNRIFISTDYGNSFKISLLPEQSDRIDHIHSIVYDPFEQLIWVATGDTPAATRIFWSSDFGENWKTHTSGEYRMTTIIPLPNSVLFGTDEEELIGTFKYERQEEGVTPENFVATKNFAHIYAEGAYIFGWTTQPAINYKGTPYAYIGSRMSHDYEVVGVGKIGIWKTDGKDVFMLWEHDGKLNNRTPYGVSSVHGPDKDGRVMAYWIDNDTNRGNVHRTIVFE